MLANQTRSALLNLLKRNESSVDDLSAQLEISPTATRQHLSILERDGLVKRTSVKKIIGRPKVMYSLTEKAEELFPKAYFDFLKWMINDMCEREGPDGIRAMMGRLGTKQGLYYKERMGCDISAEALVALLNELGCYAELKKEGGQTVIIEHNCLLYEIAKEYGDIVCDFAIKLFETVLESPVELQSSIARGDSYCSFAVEI